jgi:hypothetical protein
MSIATEQLLSLWDLEIIPACDVGMQYASKFLEAASECVNTLGRGRTSSSRAALLTAYNAMVEHADGCEKCNAV